MSDILAADYYVNNARLFEAAAKLWIKPDDVVVDPTFGKGSFYKRFRPVNLIATDLDPEKCPDSPYGIDFRELPMDSGMADVVVFDPAYVVPGGRETSTIGEMNEAYGMGTTEANLASQWIVITDGLVECVRVLRPRGIIMVKCMNYISSASYHNIHADMIELMRSLGLKQVDQFMLVKKSGGPQPKNRTRKCPQCKGTGGDADVEGFECPSCGGAGRIATVQQHARNNVSFLIVARKPK